MRTSILHLLIAFLLFSFPVLLWGQTPSLTIIDSNQQEYTAPDNSTVFPTFPGDMFEMRIEGKPFAPYGLYLSLFTTPYPTNIVPPPLFILPPIIPVVAGPQVIFDSTGQFQFPIIVPASFSSMGYDVNLYFQGFVADGGLELTNGIKVVVQKLYFRADIALARGTALNGVVEFGCVEDGDAGDNKIPDGGGPGLENGEPIQPDPDITPGHIYAFKDDYPPPDGSPDPTTSIFLNGIYPLVPGDVGFDDRFPSYPQIGSSLYIYTRDRVCRNNENEYLQHIIAPVYGEGGEKTHDLNIYHFRDRNVIGNPDDDEFGFFVVDVLNNDFYELKGTRKVAVGIESPWDQNVEVSPDGRYMAVVKKNRKGLITEWKDKLFIVKLLKEDTWDNGDHARDVKINDVGHDRYWVTQIFPESMIFAGDPDPHILFFVTNKYDKKLSPTDPPQQPPVEHASSLWRTDASKPKGKGIYFNPNNHLPYAGGDIYPIQYFGSSKVYTATEMILSELKWLRSEDNRCVCMRAAGRYLEWDQDNQEWIEGDWLWDVLSFTNITNVSTFETHNITAFAEIVSEQGFYIHPFGYAYNGRAKAAISPPTADENYYFAFTTTCYAEGVEHSEDLYLAPVDGSLAGMVEPVTKLNVFEGEFQPASGEGSRGIYDPVFVDDSTLVFYCGEAYQPGPGFEFPAKTDLFLYINSYGEYRNLTMTADIKEPEPPFTSKGDIRPCGTFVSRDRRYLFFFRGSGKDKMNLIGADSQNDFMLFDLTGDEFSNGFVPSITNEYQSYKYWGPETMNMILTPTEDGDVLFFSAMYSDYKDFHGHQVFMMNMIYPIAAFPVTSFDPSEEGMIDNLVADPTANYLAFSRSNKTILDGTAGAYEKIWAIDLMHGAYMKELTGDYPDFTRASIDGSFRFLSPSSDSSGVLIYGMGEGGLDKYADNPEYARMWLFSYEGLFQSGKATSFPLTEENLFLFFNASPYSDE